jgi:hypothetical protein
MPEVSQQMFLGNNEVFGIYDNKWVGINSYNFTGPQPVLTGLQIWVDATNPTSYSGTGSTWTDLSGNSRNMSVSATFNASPGYFEFRNTAQTNNANVSFTRPTTASFEVWVRWISSAADPAFSRLTSYGTGDNFEQSIRASGRYAYFRSSGGGWDDNAANPSFTTNTWAQVLVTYTSGGSFKMYKNGTLVRTTTHNLIAGGSTFFVGNRYTTPSEGVNADISIVRVYNAELTDAQVLQNYNADKSKFGL